MVRASDVMLLAVLFAAPAMAQDVVPTASTPDAPICTDRPTKSNFACTRSWPAAWRAYRYGRWADTVMVQRSLAAGATEPPLFFNLGR